MSKKTRIAVAAGILAGAAAVPAFAAGGDDAGEVDVPITGSDLERASAAALAYLGQGRVTETEAGDEESYYEVEVTLDDGSQVDVQLDESFVVVGSEDDGIGEDDVNDD